MSISPLKCKRADLTSSLGRMMSNLLFIIDANVVAGSPCEDGFWFFTTREKRSDNPDA
ncbi:hypothetical protein [Paremcibacter congregatus]|uniref:hypothetical protein n=1 Tax=Paremcibacter congregatus TaxID=2043170 RepID=UPI0030EE52C9